MIFPPIVNHGRHGAASTTSDTLPTIGATGCTSSRQMCASPTGYIRLHVEQCAGAGQGDRVDREASQKDPMLHAARRGVMPSEPRNRALSWSAWSCSTLIRWALG